MELPSPREFLLGLIISTALSLYVFWHADKRGNRKATTWGVATFLLGPLAALVYFNRYWFTRSRRR